MKPIFTSFDEVKAVTDVLHMLRERMDRCKIFTFAIGEYTAVFGTGKEAEQVQMVVGQLQLEKFGGKNIPTPRGGYDQSPTVDVTPPKPHRNDDMVTPKIMRAAIDAWEANSDLINVAALRYAVAAAITQYAKENP